MLSNKIDELILEQETLDHKHEMNRLKHRMVSNCIKIGLVSEKDANKYYLSEDPNYFPNTIK